MVDFSTGSVGLGVAVAPVRRGDPPVRRRPLRRAAASAGSSRCRRRRAGRGQHLGGGGRRRRPQGLGNVMWVVDFNRQSLDRVVPGVRIGQWRGQFAAAGWHVVEIKYGRPLQAAFARPGGETCGRGSTRCPTSSTSRCSGWRAPRCASGSWTERPPEVGAFVADVPDAELARWSPTWAATTSRPCWTRTPQCDAVTDRPSVIFAYTVKGWGLPIAGTPRNHSALLTGEQIDELRASHGPHPDDRVGPARPASPPRAICVPTSGARHSAGAPRSRPPDDQVPAATGVRTAARLDAGGLRAGAGRPRARRRGRPVPGHDRSGRRHVHQPGRVHQPDRRVRARAAAGLDATDPAAAWAESPTGQHIELGISEMNLFLLLGQLGLAWDLSDQPLLPVGTVYDPFVCRGLDAFIYGAYSGSRFVVAGTPSGVTLAPEGGAHQSTITASIGIELPGVDVRRARLRRRRWTGCCATRSAGSPPTPPSAEGRRGRVLLPPDDPAARPVPVRGGAGAAGRRRAAAAGARRRVPAQGRPPRPSGAAGRGRPGRASRGVGGGLPEVLEAAEELAEEGVAAHVVDVTSAGRLYRSLAGRPAGGGAHGDRAARRRGACGRRSRSGRPS